MQNKDALTRGIYHSEKSFSAGDRFSGKERLLYRSAEKRSSISIIRTTSQSGATVVSAGCCAPCAMDCTLIIFVDGQRPMVLPVFPPVPQKRYERYVWTEKGEVYFSEEAAVDHAIRYGEWPEDRVRWEEPDDEDWSPFTGYTDGTGQR